MYNFHTKTYIRRATERARVPESAKLRELDLNLETNRLKSFDLGVKTD
ncbi:hypothetical protein Hanom_Chr13g01234021 [Helianthus anomalus]